MVARGSDSPGRARYKSSSHCAGKAGVFPLNLYAHVRISLCIIAHETAGAARTRSSLRPLFLGRSYLQTSDKTMSRERDSVSADEVLVIACNSSLVIPGRA